MRISFDLDETLFVNPRTMDTEPELKFPWNLLFKEKLRKGSVSLFKEIRERGHEIYIYTTSFRTTGYIRSYFKRYGLTLDRIINGDIHKKEVQRDRKQIMPSKYPPQYQIDLHIDDDKSLKANADHLGFSVLLLKESDKEWLCKIRKEMKREKYQK